MKKNISFDDYKNCVLNDKPKNNVVKKTKDVSKVVVKKNISFGDDKNCVLNDLAKKLSND